MTGMFVVIDSSSVDGAAEVLTVSSGSTANSVPIAATPLRLAHTSGATVNAAVLGPLDNLT